MNSIQSPHLGHDFSQVSVRPRTAGAIQTKLVINKPGDEYEQEADHVAEQVVRMPEPKLQRLCACGGACPKCKAELLSKERKLLQTKRVQAGTTERMVAPTIVHDVLRSPGQALLPATRAFMETRFGHDFGSVRIHTGSSASDAARAVDARAFTFGRDIVFGAGQYAPHAAEGRRLLAHELTHVIQQGAGSGSTAHGERAARSSGNGASRQPAMVQRACGPSEIGTPSGCRTPPDFGSFREGEPVYRFVLSCDTFHTGEDARLAADVRSLPEGTRVVIHGYASEDGGAAFNEHLACARALAARALLVSPGPLGAGLTASSIVDLYSHGEVAGPAEGRRSVTLEILLPDLETPVTDGSCGPDVTDWFVDIMNNAKSDRRVLEIQRRLTVAQRVGARHGYSSTNILEGGIVRKVLVAERNAGSPTRTADAARQIASADRRNEFGRAFVAATIPLVGAPEQTILAALRGASLIWKSLVETGAVFDFKNNVLSGSSLSGAGCPPQCSGDPTVTISGTCFENDLPGNIFYAHIGRFCGFSRNTLQLGSQFAELLPSSSGGFDTPEDTAAINLGFDLPTSGITVTNMTSALRSAGSSVRLRPSCALCSVTFRPAVPLNR